MAVNALGLPLLLQASNTQLQDLLGGLKAGDVMRGRLVELLPNDKAVLNLQGQNVVAQLPAGRSFQRGDILSLQVSQATAAEPGKPANLQLRLLPGAPEAPTSLPPSAPPATPQIQLEQALSAARLPINNVTLTVAQTLASLGAPLDSQALNAAVLATEALLANEAAPSPATPAQAPLQSPLLQQTVRESLALLKVAAQLNPSSQNTVLLQQAARALESALAGGTMAPAAIGTQAPSSPGGQTAPAGTNLLPNTPGAAGPSQGAQSVPNAPSSPSAPGPAPSVAPQAPSVGQLQQAIQQAVAQLAAAPTPSQAQALAQLLAQASAPATSPSPSAGNSAKSPSGVQAPAASLSSAPPMMAPEPVGANAAAALQTTAPAAQAPMPVLATLPAQREALAQWLGQVRQESGPISAQTLAQSAQALADQLADPGQPAAQRLLQSVQAQAPEAPPQASLQAARQTLQQVADHFAQLAAADAGRSLPSASAVQAEVDSLGLPTPRLALNSLAPETVAEAVAWLQARDLPPQRPLVETVASWLAQDKAVLPPAEQAVQTLANLPSGVLDQLPSLKSAFEDARQALQSSAFRPEESGLAARLQQWAKDQGLALENSLGKSLQGSEPAADKAAAAPANQPEAAPLRPALMKLEHEVQQALRNPSTGAETAAKLDQALQDLQASTRSFNALPLQAQAAPAFDTVHLPLPVWMNGQVGAGNLSVTWRHGRERGLDEKEPVNVAVALKTESLGEVKVLLQVWKSAASARVIAESPEASDFLESGAAELREGFNTRTPFNLQALDFEAASPDSPPAEDGPEAPRSGLSLSA